MIRMVTWKTGGHQAPLRDSSICQSASSISMVTSPGTWPMDFMYVWVDNLSSSSFHIFQVFIEFSAAFSQILSQTLLFVSFICFPVTFASLSISIFPPVLQAHLFSASGVFNILCWHIYPSPSLCLPPLPHCFEQCFFYLLEKWFLVSQRVISVICWNTEEKLPFPYVLYPCQSLCSLSLCPPSS